MVVGSLGLLDLLATAIRPSVGEFQFLFAVLVVLGAYSTLGDLQTGVHHMPPIVQLLFSPPVLALLMLSSITVAPVIITNWTWLQAGAYLLGAAAGVVAADEM